jgi:CelD/BcsL family acetyltransferase involved in cellulose biosynthesis
VLEVTEINEISGFLELENDWNELFEKSEDNNVFLSWDFLTTCWSFFGEGKKLKILVIKDKNEVVAIAPLKQSRYAFGNMLGYTVIEPLGYRAADYTGLILKERKAECFNLFLNYMSENLKWDFIYLFDLPETSILPDLLSKNNDLHLKFTLVQGKKCPFIPLFGSKDNFKQSLDNNLKKDMRRCMQNLEKDFGQVALKRYDELGSVEKGLNNFFKLHQERWDSKLGEGVFSSSKNRDFYTTISKKWAEKEWLALYFLTVKGEPVAAQYCIEYQNKMSYVLGGFNSKLNKYGLGNLLTFKIIEDCIKRQINEFDFMKGDESYKFRWTDQYRQNFGIRFVNNKFASRFCNLGISLLKQTKMDRVLGGFVDY